MAEKKELQAQLDALKTKSMSDEELDNVAGGSHQQSLDVLFLMAHIDPKGTQALVEGFETGRVKGSLADNLTVLIDNNFQRKGIDVRYFGSEKGDNRYMVGGKEYSHPEFMEFLINKAGGRQPLSDN